MKIKQEDGSEVEVFTAEEVQAKVSDEVKKKETEFGKVQTGLESQLTEAKTALGERAKEFVQFRKLNAETVQKLSVTERALYENQLVQEKKDEERTLKEKEQQKASVDSAIRAKAGNNEKLFTKMKEVWDVIGIDATTPEQISSKLGMVIGAISSSQPDLVASIGDFRGSHMPPELGGGAGNKSFADTEKGKAGAAELGLIIEVKK